METLPTMGEDASRGDGPARSLCAAVPATFGHIASEGDLLRSWSVGSVSSRSGAVFRSAHQSAKDVNGEEGKFVALMEERTLSVSQANRREMHLTRLDSTPDRTDTLLGYGKSRRDLLKREAGQGARKVPINEGQTGSVFLLEVDDQKVAVFKPELGERFERRGFQPGSGSVREEAVYIVDRLCGSEAGVPVTTVAEVVVDGQAMRGAVQAIHTDVAGFCDDFGMPNSLTDAMNVVTRERAERLALLDLKIFNTDRHGGNLLFLGQRPPYGLGPIDHGCCLPPWWALGEASFSAWENWAHVKSTPSAAARASAKKAPEHLPRMCEMLRERGLDFDAIVTLRLCTTVVAIGVGEQGLPIAEVAKLMTRDDPSQLSWLEQRVFDCAQRLGVQISEQLDDRGDKILVLGNSDTLNDAWADRFLDDMSKIIRSQLQSHCSDSDDDAPLFRTVAHLGGPLLG